ncbi:hypothetical protein B0H13DRAFT_1988156 [Mycena leptocephala]|nr:hypothetical protein B0H13DRAFT_1988156 [Mycena leptocephala]
MAARQAQACGGGEKEGGRGVGVLIKSVPMLVALWRYVAAIHPIQCYVYAHTSHTLVSVLCLLCVQIRKRIPQRKRKKEREPR